MSEVRRVDVVRLAGFMLAIGLFVFGFVRSIPGDPSRRLDPAAWGSDHVGQPVPEYATGDECLFCHRKVGSSWGANRHNRTVRPLDDNSPALAALKQSEAKRFAEEIKFILGDRQRQRFLKPVNAYGKLDLLSVEWIPPRAGKPGKLVSVERPHWDATRFGDSCAGCHTTAVDPKEKAFSALSLDCFVCHGNVPAEHANKPELAHLSPKRKDNARVVTSICAQCHVRTGRSKSTGRPYPCNFVAGDNLFRDFSIDFSEDGFKGLSTADRHVLENVRDVVVLGKEAVTCLSCHNVHGGSSKKHHVAARSDSCWTCHRDGRLKGERKPFSTQSKTCGY
jgi:predicted CXXCH cytochrome family protein